MSETSVNKKKSDRFWIEKRDLDFPFYNDESFGKKENLILLSGIVLFTVWTVLSQYVTLPRAVRVIGFFVIPTIPYLIVAKWSFSPIVKKFRLYDIVLIVGGAFLEFFGSLVMASFLIKIGFISAGSVKPNPAVGVEHDFLFFIGLIIQLFGEEMVKLIVFFLVMNVLYKKTQKRKFSAFIAILVSSIFFGLLHYWTYENLILCIMVQGLTSAMISFYLYVRSKNILVTFGAHFLLDLLAIMGS